MRVGLDVDEVVAGLHNTWRATYEAKHNVVVPDLVNWDDWSTPEWYALLTPSLYDRVLPYAGTVAAVESIRRMGHEVFFVTSCGSAGDAADHAYAKEAWLRRWGYLDEPMGLMSGHIIVGKDKRNAPVDVLVDDSLKNVESFHGWSVLQTRSHNLNHTTNKARIDHLADFVEMLWQRRIA